MSKRSPSPQKSLCVSSPLFTFVRIQPPLPSPNPNQSTVSYLGLLHAFKQQTSSVIIQRVEGDDFLNLGHRKRRVGSRDLLFPLLWWQWHANTATGESRKRSLESSSRSTVHVNEDDRVETRPNPNLHLCVSFRKRDIRFINRYYSSFVPLFSLLFHSSHGRMKNFYAKFPSYVIYRALSDSVFRRDSERFSGKSVFRSMQTRRENFYGQDWNWLFEWSGISFLFYMEFIELDVFIDSKDCWI